MNILGVGIDLVKNSRIKNVLNKVYAHRFLVKVLHQDQLKQFQKLHKLNVIQVQFVSSRWAIKQAVVKATGNKQLVFTQMKIETNSLGHPFLDCTSDFNKNILKTLKIKEVLISFTMENQITMAQAIALL